MFIHTFFLYMGGVERVNETSQLTDDVSLCSYLAEHTYLSAFYKTIIIVMIKKL